ncbi:signal peptidase complex subunit SPC3 [Aspergillus clavatus NRRL 1]|uniref:Signal peptidase subunit 3 n=1 Tax=Aspergillus clavatus (strain ATCC 1007 / CBS 513.65 / DSM 816 / NCTC 3887 / NRRL 1 / QM 1276 / 107) TaxID=344612 RepID=A1C516_ASPCL|nr:microsomal signal peptidase subunit (gp23), putative [Aspergillus clavatus NRRL 1]EAW14784.1 microsomal signal peptidase subunit (gp23), putative [Aspergillus clavatus NRRL 1]
MHSSLNRAQGVFGFFTTVALCVAGLAALSVLLYPAHDAKAQVSLKNVQVIKGRPNYYSAKKEEYAQMRFDLDADLSPLFNWNTKQLFVYVYASYSSSDKKSSLVPNSESIIWDTIIPAPESPYSFNALRERFFPAKKSSGRKNQKRTNAASKKASTSKKDAAAAPGVLRLRGQRAKYQISDITGKMAERGNVTLSVGWNVQPWVGALLWSPRTGAFPHTAGTIVDTKAFDFPALKGSKASAAKASEQAAKSSV